jgi:hypothetical protein
MKPLNPTRYMSKKIPVTNETYDLLEENAQDSNLTVQQYIQDLIKNRGDKPRLQVRLTEILKDNKVDGLLVDADVITRVRELVTARAYPDVGQALRAAVKLLVIDNASTILRLHQRTELQLLAETMPSGSGYPASFSFFSSRSPFSSHRPKIRDLRFVPTFVQSRDQGIASRPFANHVATETRASQDP